MNINRVGKVGNNKPEKNREGISAKKEPGSRLIGELFRITSSIN